MNSEAFLDHILVDNISVNEAQRLQCHTKYSSHIFCGCNTFDLLLDCIPGLMSKTNVANRYSAPQAYEGGMQGFDY